MKRLLHIVFLVILVIAACTKRGDDYLSPVDVQDAEYAMLIDSVEAVYDGVKYHDFADSLVNPALDFYEKGDRPRDYWMQARCHYLAGSLAFDKNHRSEASWTILRKPMMLVLL